MFRRNANGSTLLAGKPARTLLSFSFGLLCVEFIDELVDGVSGAAWPLIRNDLRLSYFQIGMLMSLPGLIAIFVESVLGILADVWKRRVLVLAGGISFAGALLLTSLSTSFVVLLCGSIIFYPASGAFVSISQAALMDSDPARHEQSMARWTLSGSLGNVAGPLVLAAALWLGAGWRGVFAGLAVWTLLTVAMVWRFDFPTPTPVERQQEISKFRDGVSGALEAIKRRDVWRWLIMLEFGNFTWDVLRGFIALYFVDVVGVSESKAALTVLVLTLAGLPGDIILLPLLERVRGLSYLRWSALSVLILFPAFLLVQNVTVKLVLLGLLGYANAGWYSILQAQVYTALPGRSGTVMTLGNISGIIGSLLPLALGSFAQRFGLGAMMWLLLLGPVVMLIGLSRAGEKFGRLKQEAGGRRQKAE